MEKIKTPEHPVIIDSPTPKLISALIQVSYFLIFVQRVFQSDMINITILHLPV